MSALGQAMLIANGQHRLVGKQRHITEPRNILRIGSHHQVQLPPGEGRQRGEEEPGGEIHLHLRPGIAELIDGRHQPLETTVALDRHMQPTGLAAG